MKLYEVTIYVEKAIVMQASDNTKEEAEKHCAQILQNEGYSVVRTAVKEK